MRTIKEITASLKAAENIEPWMEEIKQDERTAVQKAWVQFQKRLEKKREILEEHRKKMAFDASFLPHIEALVAGVDEAGRGPLAGPVVTAAVILPNYCEALLGINDSKQLSKEMRQGYVEQIKEQAVAYAIHFQPPEVIDTINIYEATKQSMVESITSLQIEPDVVIADAMSLPIALPQHSIIKGDAKSLAIAAASILAKTARDEYMEMLHDQYPQYGFHQHAGYGTKQHLEALKQFGPTVHHRKSFEPIKTMIHQKG
ncbi:ribonuclease HII [Lysinibacillus sp. 54212]|uniref:ribonuclease HII n=1 Tax=Lysinibacillus sp. 54212 TaxID=3119829 RepID=UPI002FCB9B89